MTALTALALFAATPALAQDAWQPFLLAGETIDTTIPTPSGMVTDFEVSADTPVTLRLLDIHGAEIAHATGTQVTLSHTGSTLWSVARAVVHLADGGHAGKVTLDTSSSRGGAPTSLTQWVSAGTHAVPCDDNEYITRVIRAPRWKWHGDWQPAGAEQPEMLVLDPRSDDLLDWVDWGFGIEPEVLGGGVCRVVLAAAPGTLPGEVHLLSMNAEDADGDGLSDAVEAGIGTCSGLSATGWCAEADPVDTDGDGITDLEEVLGFTAGGTPQYMHAWGADPMHSDIFLETDWRADVADHDLDMVFDMLIEASDVLEAGPRPNPDGVDGIHLHLDLAETVPVGTLTGDFGGSTEQPADWDYHNRSGLLPGRERAFRYALIHTGDSGQASFGSMFFGVDATSLTFLHELGHTLGLQHWGTDAVGEATCKPNYPSLMNYVGGATDFSTGGALPKELNPLSVDERITDASERDRIASLLGLTNMTDGVDFNRDGVINADPVRAQVTWAGYNSCSAATNDLEVVVRTEGLDAATPSILAYGDHLIAAWVEAGDIVYSAAIYEPNGSSGGCTGGQSVDEDCVTWGAAHRVPDLGTVTAFDMLAFDGAVVFAATEEGGKSTAILRADDFDVTRGSLTAWSSPWDAPVRGVEPELVVIDADQDLYGATELDKPLFVDLTDPRPRLAVFVADVTTGAATFAVSHTGETWSPPWVAARRGGEGLATVLDPAIVNVDMPDWDHTCGVFSVYDLDDGLPRPELLCLMDGWWEVPSHRSGLPVFPSSNRLASKPSIVFHRSRLATGEPSLGEGIGQGQLWIVYSRDQLDDDPVREEPVLYVSEPLVIDALTETTPEIEIRRAGFFGNQWTNPIGRSGVALFEDDSLTAMKGLMVVPTTTHAGTAHVQFFPEADGTFDQDLRDLNDWEAMDLPGNLVR